jgi:hypothetical protein
VASYWSMWVRPDPDACSRSMASPSDSGGSRSAEACHLASNYQGQSAVQVAEHRE